MNADRWITPAWVQGALDALRDAFDVDAHHKREMIEFLYAEGLWDRTKLTWDAAITKFNACLNPDKPDRFSLVEIWVLSKRFDRPQLVIAMLEDLGYEAPRRRASEERRQAALERLSAAVERNGELMTLALQELRNCGLEGHAVRVHPAVAAGRGNFAWPDDAPGANF